MSELCSRPGLRPTRRADSRRGAACGCLVRPWLRRALAPVAIAAIALASATAHAGVLYFGEDINEALAPATTPLASTLLSDFAEADFLARLTGERTETFESLGGGSGPLAIPFPGAPGALTATLLGGGTVRTLPAGTAENGRYSVPSRTSTNFWETEIAASCTVGSCATSGFRIDFDRDVAAFGFYGIDIGDFNGQLSLAFVRADGSLVSGAPVSVGNSLGRDGSVLFFGFIAGSPTELFRSVQFRTTDASGDVFAFDRFTAATYCQVDTAVGCDAGGGGEPAPVPEPPALPLLAVALAGLLAVRRR